MRSTRTGAIASRCTTVIERMWRLEHGGTYAVFLGCDALRKGYRARIYTYNLTVFDPTWFTRPHVDIAARLARAARGEGRAARLQHATDGYLEFLTRGGRLRFANLSQRLIRGILRCRLPILTGLSSTYLYRSARELRRRNARRRARAPGRPFRRHRRLGRRAPARAGRRSVPAESLGAVARVLDQRRPRRGGDPARHRHARREPARRVSAPTATRIADAMNILVVVNHQRDWPFEIDGHARRHGARLPDRSGVQREHVGARHQPLPHRPLPGSRLLRVAARRGARPPAAAGGEDARRPAVAATPSGC